MVRASGAMEWQDSSKGTLPLEGPLSRSTFDPLVRWSPCPRTSLFASSPRPRRQGAPSSPFMAMQSPRRQSGECVSSVSSLAMSISRASCLCDVGPICVPPLERKTGGENKRERRGEKRRQMQIKSSTTVLPPFLGRSVALSQSYKSSLFPFFESFSNFGV